MVKARQSVEDYIAERSGPVREILEELRSLVRDVLPDATESMKWGAPTFTNRHGVAAMYLYGGKDHANLGFVRGAELDDPDGLLKGKGESGRHVKVSPGREVQKEAFVGLIRQCADLKD